VSAVGGYTDVAERLDEIVRACQAIGRYVEQSDVPDDLVLDAVRIRLVEIGDAVRLVPEAVTATEPGIPWAGVAELAAHVTGRSCDTPPALVLGTARADVPRLLEAVRRLRRRV
jgi:uncharacterized protein with HEPN domain